MSTPYLTEEEAAEDIALEAADSVVDTVADSNLLQLKWVKNMKLTLLR